jgi:Transposase
MVVWQSRQDSWGDSWCNLFAFLVGRGFKMSLLKPLRIQRIAEEGLERTKDDSVDALASRPLRHGRRPKSTPVSDDLTAELHQLVRLRNREHPRPPEEDLSGSRALLSSG